MNLTHKHIIESYTDLLKGLSDDNKKELIENLSRSIAVKDNAAEKAFYKSFGSFSSEESPTKIVRDIKASRKFRNKEIQL